MNALAVWKRLLWKEMREGWVVFLLALTAPLLVSKLGPKPNALWNDIFRVVPSYGLFVIIAIWGATKATSQRKSEDLAQAHFPVRRLPAWVSGVLAPTVMAMTVGCWYGWWYASLYNPKAAAIVGLAAGAVFSSAYLLSRTISQWFAIAAGAVGGPVAWVVMASAFDGPFSIMLEQEIGLARFFALALASAISCLFVLALFPHKMRHRPAQLAAVILAAIIVMAPYFEPLRVEFLGADDPYLDPCVRAVSLPDRSVVVFSDWGSFTGPLAHLVMEDHRSGYERTLKLSRIAIPIGIDRQGSFIIQQPARSEEARILRWGMDGKLSVVARIPAKRSTLIDLRQRAYLELHEGVLSISPGSGKLLIDLLSLAGTGLDLWLVDLRTGHSVIVIPNHARYRWWQTQITWGKDAVFVTGYGAPLRIDLRGTKVTAMPALERVQ